MGSPIVLFLTLVLAAQPRVEVSFSPGGGCTDAIVREIAAASASVRVQSYTFTSSAIAAALIDAHARGVDVAVIFDKSELSDQRSKLAAIAAAGVACSIDAKHAIAHNKVMVIDDRTVITGSFNWTVAAETVNAENLLIIRSTGIAAGYANNWRAHRGHSTAYQAP